MLLFFTFMQLVKNDYLWLPIKGPEGTNEFIKT